MKALLLGDVSPTPTTTSLFQKKDIHALFGETISLFEGNDINLVNLECALTERDCAIQKIGPALKAPIETAEVLREIGVNYCGLSNNHIFDFGKAGIRDTTQALENAGIIYTGFGENTDDARKDLVIDQNGEKITVITVCEREYNYALSDRMGTRVYDEYDTIEDIRNAKAASDRVIVLYHGGKEHCKFPSPRLRKLCHAMAKNGADIIVCQHSHCIGCYEEINGCHIIYGQGNFHFIRDSKIIPSESNFGMWNTSLAVLYDTKANTVSFRSLIAKEDCCGLRYTTQAEHDRIMEEFAARNEMLQNGAWIDGWRAFCKVVGKSYTERAYSECSTPKQKEIFAHYLDCEAHTDVWRELFPTKNLTNEK